MPRLVHARPKYRRHRASGQAIVEIAGKVYYLGPYGSDTSHAEYERLVSAWIRQGRPARFQPEPNPEATASACTDSRAESVVAPAVEGTPPVLEVGQPLSRPQHLHRSGSSKELTVVQLIARFWRYAKSRYTSYGRRTGTHENYRPVLRLLRRRFGKEKVSRFGPLALQALREVMIQKGNSRRYINDNIDRVRRVFTWGVSQEIVPPDVPVALATVEGLHQGAAGVVEHPAVQPVTEKTVAITLQYLPPIVADMVQIQLLTGSRPGEICIMRPMDINRSESLWVYKPQYHKTERHGKERFIVIGPRAQKILAKYLERHEDAYCFSPAESQAQMNQCRRNRRKSPMTPSQAARRPKENAHRRPGDHYTNDSYRRAVARACDKAFPPPKELTAAEKKKWREEHRWSPNQLRHAAATKICNRFESLLAAKETLGHSTIRVTETYAQPSLKFAKRAMRKLG